MVDQLADTVDAIKDLQEVEVEQKTELKTWAKDQYFKTNVGTPNPIHIFDVHGDLAVAQLNFVNKYFINPDRLKKLKKLLGEKVVGDYIGEAYTIKINPEGLTPYREKNFLTEVDELCRRYGVKVTVTDDLIVKPNFHDGRHALPPNLNKKIDDILPLEVQTTI